LASLGSDTFSAALLDFVHSFTLFDSAVLMAYPDDSSLVVLSDELDAGDRQGFDGPYREGLFRLSPLYLQCHAGCRGYFHISDIAPDGFTDSEFYQIYYSNNETIDQVAYLLQSADGINIALSIERTSALPAFSIAERQQMASLSELLVTLVGKQQWPGISGQPAGQTDLHAHVQQVLSLFGSSLLTPRERQVVRLILRGYPSKSVARELAISTQTEQVHRKNIYQKLKISSHSELFTLFFDAITVTPLGDTDPLLVLRPA
jgi:DNA-binding CsgD family transcriptional regulator